MLGPRCDMGHKGPGSHKSTQTSGTFVCPGSLVSHIATGSQYTSTRICAYHNTGGELPGPGGQTPDSGGELPGPRGQTPDSGGELPGPRGQTPDSGGELPGPGGQTPDSGGEYPGPRGQTPDSGGQFPAPWGLMSRSRGPFTSPEASSAGSVSWWGYVGNDGDTSPMTRIRRQ
eukprot:1186641-Prorocentrum_minimum.AAC.2